MSDNKKVKVLLVDDEEAFAKALSKRLYNRGLEAEPVFGGKEALESIGRDEPDVMILDLKMPGMDGIEVLRRVKKNYPDIKTIILSGHDTDTNRMETAELGAVDFLVKPADITTLAAKIRAAFKAKNTQGSLYAYGTFVPLIKKLLRNEGITLGENGLGIKCFCRDDNQDQLGHLLMSTGRNSGWFDLNSFGAYPAGRSLESLAPPTHHIPELQNNPWIVVFHATHVGCDSKYTLGMTDRYGMHRPSSSCGLLAAILNRHTERRQGNEPADFEDFEMNATEKALLPYLDDITNAPYPMAAASEKLFDLGSDIFAALLLKNDGRTFYIGGINVDFDAQNPENNFFVPKSICIYEQAEKRELRLS